MPIQIAQDLRYAFRLLLKTPAFSGVAVLTLALGIGANTAIFSVVYALLIAPLPYPQPDRLVMVWQDMRAQGGPEREWGTPGNYFDWARDTDTFAGLAAMTGWGPALTGTSEPESLSGEQVTHTYFNVLGVRPALGRTFTPQEDVPNAPRVVVLSHGLWQRRFATDPTIIGRMITLGGQPHEVIGIMPAGFRPAVLQTAELWRPLRLNAGNPSRGAVVLRIIGRLAPAITFTQAQASTRALATRLEQAYPNWNTKVGIHVNTLHDQAVGSFRTGLLVLMGAVAFVLLIACVNIANLLLARASSRAREVAVRLTLGASRSRVIRQLLTESLLLAFVGGIAGVLVASWGVDALLAIDPAAATATHEIGVNLPALGFTAAVTLLTGLLFGIMPAFQVSGREFTRALKDGGRSSAGAGGRRLRRGLIVCETAVALVLLVGGGLLMRTLVRLQAVDLGFTPDGIVAGFVLPPQPKYPTGEHRIAFYDRVLERVAAVPGVERAALTSVVPLTGDSDMSFLIEGRPAAQGADQDPVTWYRIISREYFETIGIPIRRGRNIEPRERTPAVLINEALARKYWPGEDPLGRRVRFSSRDDAPWFTIVGVAGDVKRRGARDGVDGEMYLPYWHFTEAGINVVAKSAITGESLFEPLRQAVREVDPDMPVAGLTTMSQLVGESIQQPRFIAGVVGAFATVALLLAAAGIYGVMSYGVAQRLPEIGIRVALGATRHDVLTLIMGDGLRLTALGIAIGTAGALVVTRSMNTLLFGVGWADPLTLAATTILVLIVAAVASLVPARRATRADPMTALRAE
jgi:putative ABC transport system permease protein